MSIVIYSANKHNIQRVHTSCVHSLNVKKKPENWPVSKNKLITKVNKTSKNSRTIYPSINYKEQ